MFLAKDIQHGKFYAMKAMKKEEILNDDGMEQVNTERNVLALGSSFPYFTQLHSTFTTPVCANIALSLKMSEFTE